jgi:hypothetical protein
MVIEEKFDKKTIEQIDAEIKRCVKGANKIENGNYILAMLLKDIKEGKVKNIVEVAEWCFEKINIGREVDYVLTKLEKNDIMDLSKEKEKTNE